MKLTLISLLFISLTSLIAHEGTIKEIEEDQEAILLYNKGNELFKNQEYENVILAITLIIESKPDFTKVPIMQG